MRLLSIAGHDPVHGAGLTADLATWAAMGLDGASVVTTLTVQNSSGLQALQPVSAAFVRDTLRAVLEDGEPDAIKVGMLGSASVAREVADFLSVRRCPVVIDPVMAGSNGHVAFEARDGVTWLAALRDVAQHADVVTPNLPEAAAMLGVPEHEAAARLAALREFVRGAVMLKGGHGSGPSCVDLVHDGQRSAAISGPRFAGSAHGSGCVYAAALAGALARGADVFDAACEARQRVSAGLLQARAAPGRPNMQATPVLDSVSLPSFRWGAASAHDEPQPFAPLTGPLGFYPVLPTADWIERALGWGVRTLQLRIKDGAMAPAERRAHLRAAVRAAAEVPGAQLFINDHWDDAIALGAYGVHLGQEDMDTAGLAALRDAGLRLGVSSHTPLEMSHAHALRPSYLAIGPVYATTLKAMRYDPVGLVRLRDWTRRCRPAYPVVAIGGIDLERAPGALACGVDSVAAVSAVTQAPDPREAVRAFLRLMPVWDGP